MKSQHQDVTGRRSHQMAHLRELTISLLDWESRAVLEALTREMQRLKVLAETSDDEDEGADVGNDFLEIGGLLERLQSQAKSIW
jgi:hypothetical protein